MKPGELTELNKSRHDHLDVHVGCMVAQINQAEGLRSQLARAVVTGSPIVYHRRIESGLVKLMFDEEAPVVRQRRVDLAHTLEVACEHAAEMLLAGKVSTVANPNGVRLRAERLANLNALQVMLDCLLANFLVRMRETTKFVRALLAGPI